jgi:hypothetical protein
MFSMSRNYRGLYPTLGSQKTTQDFVSAMMWVLNLSDGDHDLIDISQQSKIPFKTLASVVNTLINNGIIKSSKMKENERKSYQHFQTGFLMWKLLKKVLSKTLRNGIRLVI